jgi:hypothetical protein
VFSLRTVKRKVTKGRVTLRLAIPRPARRALADGRRARVRVVVTARSATGAKLATGRRTIALRR